ncbi:hypothetical protein B0T16DRAFT_461701 [Cercophora newfieldiana]|uniref:Uncharacterized protein n=1 Tax=Cercophora newfieldiana TaxID=92897 RepID=A0AA40CKE5_9PEZI|nr:hypothetical protein B0T16DRAFT_461701 [Cercophora newfieldiana]
MRYSLAFFLGLSGLANLAAAKGCCRGNICLMAILSAGDEALEACAAQTLTITPETVTVTKTVQTDTSILTDTLTASTETLYFTSESTTTASTETQVFTSTATDETTTTVISTATATGYSYLPKEQDDARAEVTRSTGIYVWSIDTEGYLAMSDGDKSYLPYVSNTGDDSEPVYYMHRYAIAASTPYSSLNKIGGSIDGEGLLHLDGLHRKNNTYGCESGDGELRLFLAGDATPAPECRRFAIDGWFLR